MKEITAILNIEVTAVAQMTDEEAAEWEKDLPAIIEQWLRTLLKDNELDKAEVRNSKIFIRDLGEREDVNER